MSCDDIIRPDLADLAPYAPGLRASEVRERTGRDRVLKLSSNEHPCGPFASAMRAMQAVLPHLNRYPDGSVRALRRKLAERHGVGIENVVVGNGSNELLELIGLATLQPGDEVVYSWPSFVVYPMMCAKLKVKAVPVDLTDDTHDLDKVLAAITEKTRIVFVCNPNNPTGSIYRREEFRRFMEAVPPHVLVVADEAYIEFVTDPDFPDALEWFDGERPLAVCRTFSKMYSLAGLRVGYTIVPAALADALDRVRAPFNANMVGQIAAYYSLDDDAEVQRRRAENQEQKTYLYSCFDRLGIAYVPSEANFVYFKTDRPVEVFDALLSEGVIVRGFGTSPGLRMTIGTPEDTEVVIKAFEAVHARLGRI